ncbi:type IX secretion system sortase PorU [Lutibacter citreus]|uniref:type IX secretion system sortase PorU n=1 Tax=Lutibacter citreus TaxID=2138210 RepID=UPI000DBE1148|nr:type IX secretion system sortase PorU [Lutibacter citreus]
MKQIQIILIFLLFISVTELFSQQKSSKKINLIWEDNIEFVVNKDVTINTCFVKGNLLNESLIPVYDSDWEIEKGKVLTSHSISNVVYENINSNYSIPKEFIGASLSYNLNIANDKEKSFLALNLIPIIKVKNKLKRVISFQLNYSFGNYKNSLKHKSSVKNSVLANGKWFKFSINKTGVYKIDKNFLEKLGVDVNTINPKNIKIYGNGGKMLSQKNSNIRPDGLQENSIYIGGESDSSFDNGDFILFYAQGPHYWEHDSNPNLNTSRHIYNIYSEESFYFLTISDSLGKRISTKPEVLGSANLTFSSFDDFTFYEKDEVNLFGAGQQWFGDDFNFENINSYSIPFDEIDSSEKVKVRVRGVVQSYSTTSMDILINDSEMLNINYGTYSGLTGAIANENIGEFELSGDEVNIDVEFNNNSNPGAKAWLDYIEVLGRRKLIAKKTQYNFRNFSTVGSLNVFEYSIQNSNNIKWVWDVTNPLDPKVVENKSTGSNFTFNFNGGELEEYLLIPENDYYSPNQIDQSVVENQNLHSLNNIDYILITQNYLFNEAQRLANFHKVNSGLITKVVSLNEIYNEFSSGSQDVTAIRDFIKHLYNNSTTNKIKYVCLFGDASYDFKDRIEGNNNIVPVFEAYNSFNLASSYVTDDYYGMMDENEGLMNSFERQDVATGRIPVTDVIEAKQVVDKILDYYSEDSFGNWRTRLTLIADDIDSSGEEIIQLNMEKIADSISSKKPVFNLNKIYLDAYTQETTSSGKVYPTVNLDILNKIESGTLLIDYFGHGGENGWASEGILRLEEIQKMENKNKLPLFVTVTCDFSRFDNPLRKTAGEFLFWEPNYGAGSLISTSREIYISVGQVFNDRLIKPLLKFDNENLSIAECLVEAKNQFSTTQRFFIFNFGDPAMHLSVPEPSINITAMNGKDVATSTDTIKALSYIKFEGDVADINNNVLSDYNGEIDISVFDKAIIKSTLDNDSKNIKMQFDVIDSKIFEGRSKVENGKFTFDFVAPKDLKVAYGKGKLSFYATDKKSDKAGFNFDITVGGINKNAPEDTKGPVVQLYMNDLNFVDGGTTDSSPMFIGVLEDENGINTSITAVDHDIVAILDNDQANPIILNDYYQTDLNNYKKGKVTYSFKDLSEGMHTIDLKVWDTYNNLTESTFTFTVTDSSDLILTKVLNYPNPFVNYTEFWFNHNKPNELLNIQVQIFTVSGKLVKTINETVQADGNLCRSLNWNGLDDFGSKIGKGVYVYKIKVKAINSNTTAHKTEKLVILQ